jgi:hypothetical protein
MKQRKIERRSRPSSRAAAEAGGEGGTNDLSYNRLLDSNEHMDLYGEGKNKGEGKGV